jgi:hypothetical protein
MEDVILTSGGNVVRHDHPEAEQGELLPVTMLLAQQFAQRILTPDTFSQEKPPSRCYNCFALTFSNRHGWVRSPEVAIADDFVGVTGAPQVGDVVLYLKDALLTHSAEVVEVNEAGEVTKVKGKWGEAAELIHDPHEVPPEYGIPTVFLHRVGDVTAPDTKCPSESAAEGATEDEVTGVGAPVASPIELAEDDLGTLLIVASSDDMRDRIIRSRVGPRASGAQGAVDLSALVNVSETADDESPAAPAGGGEPDVIKEQLALLLDSQYYGRLLLASTTGVTRRIVQSLPPVRQLAGMVDRDNPNDPVRRAIGEATLELFLREETHAAEKEGRLASVLLFLLRNYPVRRAARPLSEYLLDRNPVGVARTFAVEAFAASVVS